MKTLSLYRRHTALSLLGALLLCPHLPASAAETETVLLDRWIEAQADLKAWSANVRQTRILKTLTQPLVSQGKVWFVPPGQFRWELGQPPTTIAVRFPEEMRVYYPGLKRMERFPLDQETTAAPWRDAMALLEAGFPKSRADLEAQFRLAGHSRENQLLTLTLEPRRAAARRLIPKLIVQLQADSFALRATELHFSDGSSMRNEFSDIVRNPTMDPALLNPETPPDYEVVDPLSKNGPPF